MGFKVPSPGWMAYMQSQMDKEEREREREKNRTSDTCPICGKALYRRNGKFGEFFGCSGYPDCRFTMDID